MRLTSKILFFIFFIAASFTSFAQEPASIDQKAKEKARAEAEERARKEAQEKQKEAGDVKSYKIRMANAQAQAFYSKAMSQINTKHISWINETSEKLKHGAIKETAIRQYTKNYVKAEGVNEQSIDGLIVLVVQEAYDKIFKESDDLYEKINVIKYKKYKLQDILLRVNDSTKQFSRNELDSINLLISDEKLDTKKKSSSKTEEAVEKAPTTEFGRSPDANSVSVADLALVKKKINNAIEILSDFGKQQSKQLAEINDKQDQLQGMLYMMMQQVSESQISIIEHLK